MEVDSKPNTASRGQMPRDADIFSTQLETVAPPPAASSDPVEIWAKRSGRVIGLILLVILALNLATGWFF